MKLLLSFLVVPLLFVMAARAPEAAGHLAELIIVAGARLLNGVAVFLSSLLTGH